MIKTSTKEKGFTLMELLIALVIIIILAVIVIIPINPAQRILEARNNQREVDINAVYGALRQYNSQRGEFPECADEGEEVDLEECESELVPGYLGTLPEDPSGDVAGTGYLIKVSGDQIGVKAEHAEGDREITAGEW